MNRRSTKSAARNDPVEMLEERRLMSVAFGSNLVLDPGAETFTGQANGYNVITPDDWSANGDPTVALYSSGYGPRVAMREPQGSGKAFFTGGPDTSGTQFYQSIDLSSISSQIDDGEINFDMSAALGGFSHFNAYAQLYVIFNDADGNEIAGAVTATVLASGRNNASKLLYRTQTGTIPAGTQSAEVMLQFNRPAPSGYNTAYADDVRFVVYTNTPSTVGIAPTVARSTLPATGISELKVPGGLDLTLANNSTSKNIGPVIVSLYASTDGQIDSSSILLDAATHQLSFGAGQIEQVDIPVKTLDVPAGTYIVFAQTTDQYGTVDDTVTGPTITVAPQTISLSASVAAVSPTAIAGRDFSFTLTLENSGNIESLGAASIAIGLSTNGTTVSVPLTTVTGHVSIAPGNRPTRIRFKVRVPIGLSGAFKPIVTFSQGEYSATAAGASTVTIMA